MTIRNVLVKTRALIAATLLLTLASMTLSPTSNSLIRRIEMKLSNFNRTVAEDRVYVHTDKGMYSPGESIWFTAYVRQGEDLKPSRKSEILHLELINPRGNAEEKVHIICKDGVGTGEVPISPGLAGGLYKLKASTQWQKNDENAYIFEKEIQVQKPVLPRLKMKLDFLKKAHGPGSVVVAKLNTETLSNEPLANSPIAYSVNIAGMEFISDQAMTDADGKASVKFALPKDLSTRDVTLNMIMQYDGQPESISRTVPVVLSDLRLSFYPEGGDMVAGLPARVAFQALNVYDKPADVSGKVFDQNDRPVATFESLHQGMGVFDLPVDQGANYYAKITEPAGIEQKFKLPAALDKGAVMSIKSQTKDKITMSIHSTLDEEVSLIGQVRSFIYYKEAINVNAGENTVNIPLAEFPQGVAQFTLFDSKGIERAERLSYIDKDQYLDIEITTDKEQYYPREKVKMTINVKDERGMGMPADVSLAVVDDKLLSYSDDRQGHILSQLMLEGDVQGKIEEPNFYFDKSEANSVKARDYLMMTRGWRRFTWKKILEMDSVSAPHPPERAIVAGIFKARGNVAIPSADIRIVVEGDTIRRAATNSDGKFYISNLDLSLPTQLHLTADGQPDTKYTVTKYGEDLVIYAGGGGDDVVMMARAGGARMKNMRFEAAEAAPMMMDDMVVEEQAMMVEADDDGMADMADGEILEMEPDFKMGMPMPPGQGRVPSVTYQRAREFPAMVYDEKNKADKRSDFRSTVFWKGRLELDKSGKTEIEFYNGDLVSSFRAVVEGMSQDGTPGRGEHTYFTQLPMSIDVKVPVAVAMGDNIALPVTLINKTAAPVKAKFKVNKPDVLEEFEMASKYQMLKAGESKTIYLNYEVLNLPGKHKFGVSLEAGNLRDSFEQEINVVPRGYPISQSFSGRDQSAEYKFEIEKEVAGSIEASVTAYPSVTSELLAGVEAILREPSGCFEQTSMSSYPNALVLDYLRTNEFDDPEILEKAENLLDKGYKKLVSFETAENGYEWFGGSPAHEALTAYGLMQFNDMKSVYPDMDDAMVSRTSDWIMSRRDGTGGFKKSEKALDSFGRASDDITNAYIVYSLSEAGIKDIQKELDAANEKAKASADPYQLALVANAYYNMDQPAKGEALIDQLLPLQGKDGSWNGKSHSITRSTGKSLLIETTSLAIMAILKMDSPTMTAMNNAVTYLVGSRSGRGAFGSTQGTILALKALTMYAKFSQQTEEDGTIEVSVNGKKIASKDYKKGDREPIVFAGLGDHLSGGKGRISINYKGVEKPLPYSVLVDYYSTQPNNSPEAKVDIKTNLLEAQTSMGKTMRLNTVLTNKTEEGQPMTVAVVGIPGGLTPQPQQLKELQEQKVFDFYEILDNKLIFYYRQLEPSATKEINVDLKADIAGDFTGAASSAYLYYTNEHKHWSEPLKIYVGN